MAKAATDECMDVYNQMRREVDDHIHKLRVKLDKHRLEANRKMDWGYVGDLGRILELLKEAT